MNQNFEISDKQILLEDLGKIAYTLDKAYLSRLDSDYDVQPFDEYNIESIVSYASNIRALEVKRWVYDKDEKIADCFKNVLSVFADSGTSLALVIQRTPTESKMYFVVKNTGHGENEFSKNNIGLLNDSLCGNFPGTETSIVDVKNKSMENLFDFPKFKSIAVLSNVPSEKSENYICQGIDKLLNGIVPKKEEDSYFVVILAEALKQATLCEILSGYQDMATKITPFASYKFQAGENATETEGEMESLSLSEGISHSVTKTHSVNVGINAGLKIGINAIAEANVGGSLGYGYSWGTNETKNTIENKTKGKNLSTSLGTSHSTTYTHKSYLVANLIEKLEATIKRINESQATGLWKCASYVITQNAKQSKNIANFLRSLTQGDKSFIEPSFIQEWSKHSGHDIVNFDEISKYLKHFCHPVFENKKDKILVTPTTNVSTTELSNVFAFPRYSMHGLPVVESVRFGREPHSLVDLRKDLNIGRVYNMRKQEENSIYLSKNELAKQVFITGSAGSGKSNTIHKLIEQLCLVEKNNTKFLVIEPAKGEYKDIFGGRADVTLYGTNPLKSPNLLQINPFSFPDDIHVLEHIDRIVEVFNASWPMYAAMSAIFKDSIGKAYEECGWNLKSSKNPGKFPTFDTLLNILPKVLDSSAYSTNTSNDYKGALIARVHSLTCGIYGQIFAADISEDEGKLLGEKLFNNNAIVDISRIGSSETKSLIMGVLVLKLQEFRMSGNFCYNNDLRHVTVLEEAHNLLCKTSSGQSQESLNLKSKAIEMLANAITEMRVYGEGFIIADQSPGLMDMSVIRNTNTKIILRLPDESDRLLVGKAAGLNDSQIGELSRLEKGVAAISQSDWLEPVLCKIDKFNKIQTMN